jgi:hypothetical protein
MISFIVVTRRGAGGFVNDADWGRTSFGLTGSEFSVRSAAMDGILVVDEVADAVSGVVEAPGILDVDSFASLMGAFCEGVRGWLMELKAR